MQCAFCEKQVDLDNTDNYREVTSWVTGPKLDGPVLREQTGRVAHQKCVDNLVHGQAPDQPELFDPNPIPCLAPAKKGIEVGLCEGVLDEHGICPRTGDHLDD